MRLKVLLVSIILLSAIECHATDVVFDLDTANSITVELEQGRICQEETGLLQGMVDSLNGQVEIQEQEISESKKAVESSLKLVDEQKNICDARVEDAKPKLKDKAKWGGIGAAILVVLEIVLIAVLQ